MSFIKEFQALTPQERIKKSLQWLAGCHNPQKRREIEQAIQSQYRDEKDKYVFKDKKRNAIEDSKMIIRWLRKAGWSDYRISQAIRQLPRSYRKVKQSI